MIVAERKPIREILDMIAPHKRILLLGCGGCVTVCNTGGRKEVGVLAAALRLAAQKEGRELDVVEATIERQCDREFIEPIRESIVNCDAVLSMACGAGVQFIGELYHDKPAYPALNTTFLGVALGHGVWSERCRGCGECLLGVTGGVCPVARCAKQLFNGPCGGSTSGKCEVNPDTDCAWQLVYERLKALGRLEAYKEFIPPKDWSKHKENGPRIYIREDLAL